MNGRWRRRAASAAPPPAPAPHSAAGRPSEFAVAHGLAPPPRPRRFFPVAQPPQPAPSQPPAARLGPPALMGAVAKPNAESQLVASGAATFQSSESLFGVPAVQSDASNSSMQSAPALSSPPCHPFFSFQMPQPPPPPPPPPPAPPPTIIPPPGCTVVWVMSPPNASQYPCQGNSFTAIASPSAQLQPQMQPQLQPQMQLQMQPQMQQQIQPQMRTQMQPQMQQQIQPQMRTQMQPQMQQQMQLQLQPQIQSQMQPQMQPQMRLQMQPQMQTHTQLQMPPHMQSQMQPQMAPQMVQMRMRSGRRRRSVSLPRPNDSRFHVAYLTPSNTLKPVSQSNYEEPSTASPFCHTVFPSQAMPATCHIRPAGLPSERPQKNRWSTWTHYTTFGSDS